VRPRMSLCILRNWKRWCGPDSSAWDVDQCCDLLKNETNIRGPLNFRSSWISEALSGIRLTSQPQLLHRLSIYKQSKWKSLVPKHNLLHAQSAQEEISEMQNLGSSAHCVNIHARVKKL
jgi:hypothetical protein